MSLTPLELAAVFCTAIALVATVFFAGGRLWERAGAFIESDDDAQTMTDWVHEVRGEDTPPPRPALQLAPPPAALPAPLSPMPSPGPVRSYSALAALRLEQETSSVTDTSVTKLTASIVRGMDYREQIDTRAALILAETRHALAGEQAA